MTKPVTALTTIAFMLWAGTLAAQDATAEAKDDTAASSAKTELNMGEDASTPQIGQSYVRETEQDWEIQCVRVEEDQEEPCNMYQLLKDAEGNPVAEISLFRLPAGGQAEAGATIIVPLETSLQAQLRISVDGSQGKRYPYSFCNQIGCFARIGLTGADVNSFKRGAAATMTIVPFLAPDQKVSLSLSLKGFTASYAKTSEIPQ